MKPMVKPILVCLFCGLGLVLLFAAVVSDQPERNAASSQEDATLHEQHSSIRFSERTMRLKAVNSGETSSGFIFVENTGSKIITDVDIKVGCGCTDVQISKTDMNPGDSIKVDFSIDTRGKYEDFTEQFLFTYSEGGQNRYDVFHVTVPILAPGKLIAEPSSLHFNRTKVGEQFSRNIMLRVKDMSEGESIDIVDISSPDWISVNLAKNDAHWELTLAGVFPNQQGRYVEFVRLTSSSERYSEMVIPVIVEYAPVFADEAVQ